MTDTPTFTWAIQHWEVSAKPVNGFSGVVLSVAWKLTANLNGAQKIVFGKAVLPPPVAGSKTFVPKASITQSQLIEWIKPIMDYDGYVKNLTAQLNALISQQQSAYEVPVFAPEPAAK
ncbi:MAG: hypothetical protein RB191_12495 [Terriglobia bacterium]|nr:hypothetical protein [Terriglobia bacterium]